MNHHKTARKFGREKKVRNALLKSLALSMVVNGKITTTESKARELRPFIEKLVTLAKKNNLATRRLVVKKLSNRHSEVKKLFETIAPKYMNREGGYTRVLKLGVRKSDGASMAQIEYV